MTDAFEDLREQIELQLIVPPFEHIRRRRARKTQVAVAFASTAAVAAIVAGATIAPGRDRLLAKLGTAGAARSAAPTAARGGESAGLGPRLLLTAAGWRVTRVDESFPPDGEMTFANGSRTFDLNWRAASTHESYVADRAASAGPPAKIVVAGREGVLFLYKDSPNDRTAMWLDGNHSFELRGQAPEEEFRALAATLKAVDDASWLAALPTSAVSDDERATVIAQMRTGVPTPPGFDESRLSGKGVVDRYQLGALVAGQLACGWFDQWVQADRAGDAGRKAEAAAVLAGSKGWPVLVQMVESGDYPEVLWSYVDQVAAGGAAPVGKGEQIRSGGYVSGLGCNRPG